jgi:hypothetical protein
MNLRSSTKSSGAIDFHKHAALWLIVMLVLYILSGHLTVLFLCKLHLPPPRQPQINCYVYFAANHSICCQERDNESKGARSMNVAYICRRTIGFPCCEEDLWEYFFSVVSIDVALVATTIFLIVFRLCKGMELPAHHDWMRPLLWSIPGYGLWQILY